MKGNVKLASLRNSGIIAPLPEFNVITKMQTNFFIQQQQHYCPQVLLIHFSSGNNIYRTTEVLLYPCHAVKDNAELYIPKQPSVVEHSQTTVEILH